MYDWCRDSCCVIKFQIPVDDWFYIYCIGFWFSEPDFARTFDFSQSQKSKVLANTCP